ncbi:PDZ domain-containing protein [bacterium]|nr:MAG: PDZ domain-containing protein [bacterium]RIK60791.1 MAG: hypothetical protein DCC64_14070 [Planctomycetota bacterium]
MTVKFALAFAAGALSLLGIVTNVPLAETTRIAAAPRKAPQPCVDSPTPDRPVGPLLNPFLDDRAVFQDRRDNPDNWKPQEPFDLSGPAPSDEVVRNAIISSVNYVLERQNANGSWDVELTGSILSETADEAVDAVAITALCGIALRQHIKVDPARIQAALDKATDFIVGRVIRGKLSTKIYYAVWRYSWGLKYLTGEFQATKDPVRREELKSCARRMVQSLINMQLSNSEMPRMDRKRKAKMSSRLKATAMPSEMGLIVKLPTDDDYRGGAEVTGLLPGSAAEKAGFKVGDRIVMAEGVKIENAFDYYMLATEWLGGQKIQFNFTRPGEKLLVKEVTLPPVWPGYMGIKVGNGTGQGPTIEEFLKFSPSKKELKIGDAIIEINKMKIATLEDYRKAEATIMPGNKVRITFMRDGKKKTETVEATPAPEGTFGFGVEEEDKGDEGGVVLSQVPEGSPAEAAGMQKGDRLIQIDHQPILGLDHFIDYIGTLAGGKTVKCKLLRDGAVQEVECLLAPIALPGDPQFDLIIDGQLRVVAGEVLKGGVAEKAGVKQGWIVTKVNGTPTPTLREFLPFWWSAGFAAGDEVTFTFMMQNGKEIDVKIEFQKPVYKEEIIDVGGWNYYPMGVAASFCSAATLINLYNVQSVMGLKIPKEVLASGANMLESLRHVDVANGKTECYLYSGDAKTDDPRAAPARDMRGTMGRIAVCEMALVVAGRRKSGDLKRILDTWIKNRHELDRVRDFWHTHFRKLYFNAAYYWLFGHYHTCIAANYVGGSHKKKIQEITLKALFLKRKPDGTWSDHEAFGPLVGVSEALMILGEIDGPFRDGYPAATQPKTGEPGPSGDGAPKQPETPEKPEE